MIFYLWEHDYGHNLDPKAIMKFTNPDGSVMGFQPPLLGSKDILNFRAHSYPQLGVYFLIAGMISAFFAFWFGKKAKQESKKSGNVTFSKVASILLIISLSLSACNIEPKPIAYGEDGCHFCQMTIVDKMYAAELVTKKGKVFKFDATECMINQLKTMDADLIELFLSTNYAMPMQLIDAKRATFLISKNLPSPMGANLTAFETRNDAITKLDEKGGKLYTWNELITFSILLVTN